LNIAWNFFGRCCWILDRRPSCYTLSKACDTSRNTAEQYFLASKAKVILFVILWICSTVTCLLRKPNWWFGLVSFLLSQAEKLVITFWRRKISRILSIWQAMCWLICRRWPNVDRIPIWFWNHNYLSHFPLRWKVVCSQYGIK